MENKIVVFQDKKIRRIMHDGEWYFSVADIILVLTESEDELAYWRKLKQREPQLVTICHGFKIPAKDGKLREMDCVNTKNAFRLIQSIPSKKAEPFNLWLAQVGYERVQEIENPELSQDRMVQLYKMKGYSDSWIDKRIRGIAVRQDLTEEWMKRGVESQEDFSILTAEISKACFGMTPLEYKKHKGLGKENLRDHMTDLELIFTMLGEASTTEIEKAQDPKTIDEHKEVSKQGGRIA